jgi:DNA-directed RNA polymerase subunit RPC12/RpoP
MKLTIARCENCGAALRLDPDTAFVTCDYCHVKAYVRDAPPDAPRVTIAPPPEPPDETRMAFGATVVLALLALGAVALFVDAVLTGDPVQGMAGVVGALVFAFMAVAIVIIGRRGKRELEEFRLLREHGLPGRATVRALGGGQGLTARLQLVLEAGGPTRDVVHETRVPALLVPKVTAGAALPVLVHPKDPDHIEIQWHLL